MNLNVIKGFFSSIVQKIKDIKLDSNEKLEEIKVDNVDKVSIDDNFDIKIN